MVPIIFLMLTAARRASQFGTSWQDRTWWMWYISWRRCSLSGAHPQEFFTDNDPAFCSREFRAFACEWGVNLWFCCAHASAGNGIAEYCPCMVKWIAAKMHCPIQEAVYWHNVALKDNESLQTVPANRIHQYELRVKGVDAPTMSPDPGYSFYQIGDCVWVKVPQSWCTM